jgi:hypothetical protein
MKGKKMGDEGSEHRMVGPTYLLHFFATQIFLPCIATAGMAELRQNSALRLALTLQGQEPPPDSWCSIMACVSMFPR